MYFLGNTSILANLDIYRNEMASKHMANKILNNTAAAFLSLRVARHRKPTKREDERKASLLTLRDELCARYSRRKHRAAKARRVK